MRLLSAFILYSLSMVLHANPLQYKLDVQIDGHKLVGQANISTIEDIELKLDLNHLTNIIINQKAISQSTFTTTLSAQQPLTIQYELQPKHNIINPTHVFLTHNWYPQPVQLATYQLTATLPKGFIANSEAETIKQQSKSEHEYFSFDFAYPVDNIHLMASTDYVIKHRQFKHIQLQAYFFKNDIGLADTYLDYAQQYIETYEKLLTPYPYKRFAIVENLQPTGYAMPTYTLLGQTVIKLPFIVKTSLGHEILHSWFGNTIYADFEQGNWLEGLTTYLADHYYKKLSGEDVAYRKNILLQYQAYVNDKNSLSIKEFRVRNNKAQSSVGYGKTMMLFHQLQQRVGEEVFLQTLRDLLQQYARQKVSWVQLQTAFETATQQDLSTFFEQWITRKDIPEFIVKNTRFAVVQGQQQLSFTVEQQTEQPYQLSLPVVIDDMNGQHKKWIEVSEKQQNISLILNSPPHTVTVDPNYDVMRKLLETENIPILANILAKDKILVTVNPAQKDLYQPLINSLGVENVDYVEPKEVTFVELQQNTVVIAGEDNLALAMLRQPTEKPSQEIALQVYKNPYNFQQNILWLYADSPEASQNVARRISHYGQYSQLSFNQGRNIQKSVAQAANGMRIYQAAPSYVQQPKNTQTLQQLLPKIEDKSIIYVGEQHDQFAHHLNQLVVIQYLHEKGHSVAIGMEMFQRPYQQALDEYIGEMSNEKHFLQDSAYFAKWRFDYNLYKPIIDYAREQGIPVIALNIEGDVTRSTGREGLHNLTENLLYEVPEYLDFTDLRYQQDLYDIFGFHATSQGHQKFEHFLQAQTLWDDTMADSVDEFLQNNPDMKMVVLAGNGHLRYGYGIPKRVFKRNELDYVTILQDTTLDAGVADYVLMTEKVDGEQAPKLGVMIEEIEGQLKILHVSGNTPAHRAELKAGDTITRLQNTDITTVSDLKYALFYVKFDESIPLQVMRDGKPLGKTVTFTKKVMH
ncbi:ChaN family lipoprotein [Candidatus Albibeggiatoa sp. nov. NOAA]|uniref:ChaN family lipoprotein n=1 Tax=Candidatus Albibeggiatoa sp. nov. NOAA TaxID=3162724 RepID=UPI00330531A4|nr:ChaN family lipoprotein [Thiotrichaceae bacterium]